MAKKRNSKRRPIQPKFNYKKDFMYDRKSPTELLPGSILLHGITPTEFYEQLRAIIKEELQQDQLLTKEGALKISGVSNATFLKAINAGIIHPQLVRGRTRAMYLESEVLKLEKKRKHLPEEGGGSARPC